MITNPVELSTSVLYPPASIRFGYSNMSTCVIIVVPVLYPITFGNGPARHVPENAAVGVDDAFYAQSEFGI